MKFLKFPLTNHTYTIVTALRVDERDYCVTIWCVSTAIANFIFFIKYIYNELFFYIAYCVEQFKFTYV